MPYLTENSLFINILIMEFFSWKFFFKLQFSKTLNYRMASDGMKKPLYHLCSSSGD